MSLRLLPFLFILLFAAVEQPAFAQPAPEAGTGRPVKAKQLVLAKRHMVAAAHPLAAEAGRAVLNAGGNAMDAALAVQLVLGVVEPQSSGIGGGGFLLYYDAKKKSITAWDGRETAPAAARPERFMAEGKPLPFASAVASGLSVGVPGLMAMLEAAHGEHGRMGWEALFGPALRYTDYGFPITPRLAALIAGDRFLAANPQAREVFFHRDGAPLRAGDRLQNLELGRTLRWLSRNGAKDFYNGDIARDIVAAVRAQQRPGDMTEADLAAYQPRRREALCTTYRLHRICGMPPPSSGAATIAMMLGMLERFPLPRLRPDSAEAAHLFIEAGSLAYADRDRYLADPDFAPAPLQELLSPRYLAQRSALIRSDRSLGQAQPGAIISAAAYGEDNTLPLPATTHVSIVDAEGNAVALTSSVEAAFGSRIMVRGFLLNNQLTDFSFQPATGPGGVPAANRVEPGKRPRSSMSPTLVFGPDQRLRYVLGSPGGSMIINYVAQSLVSLIDWKRSPQAALDAPHFGSRNRGAELEAGEAAEALAPALRALGHTVSIGPETSGLHAIAVDYAGGRRSLRGGADPRREGVAVGD